MDNLRGPLKRAKRVFIRTFFLLCEADFIRTFEHSSSLKKSQKSHIFYFLFIFWAFLIRYEQKKIGTNFNPPRYLILLLSFYRRAFYKSEIVLNCFPRNSTTNSKNMSVDPIFIRTFKHTFGICTIFIRTFGHTLTQNFAFFIRIKNKGSSAAPKFYPD